MRSSSIRNVALLCSMGAAAVGCGSDGYIGTWTGVTGNCTESDDDGATVNISFVGLNEDGKQGILVSTLVGQTPASEAVTCHGDTVYVENKDDSFELEFPLDCASGTVTYDVDIELSDDGDDIALTGTIRYRAASCDLVERS